MEILRNRRLLKPLLAIGLGAVSLTACGESDPTVTRGVPAIVREHEHRDAYTTYIPIVTGRVTTIMPIFHPERFYLDVEQCGHKEFKKEDNPDGCGIIQVDVNKDVYNNFQDGETIVFNK